MKVDLEKIRLAKSALSDKIFVGIPNKDNISWRCQHEISSDFLKAVIERFAGFKTEISGDMDDVIYEVIVRKKTGEERMKFELALAKMRKGAVMKSETGLHWRFKGKYFEDNKLKYWTSALISSKEILGDWKEVKPKRKSK